ncbi:hypothetical protein [Mycoplasmopsis fermentans]|uniref:DUF4064 domain-containing protein n=2 Tax=Mycoplasmopsis fermentans TaxID=2115 RepID=C4XFC6_MYCFP|nr:hypothetical protein [Mycoplasmopsis fermentans]VEU67577.1 Uncharacterised protein [Mesomycoplasma conjunctivae]ADN68965.1 hypothetical membrane spanning protein [Mycoplasmopsis fermentans JER]ADV34413.1 Hypothetical Protein MfeM64YM_0411 [Mycoplasmopsis fermentans M64]RMX35656.1 hypothetical protein MFI1_0348 [Mycoplasmopsis fermentans MF-I1]VEU64167.1 Uncharacterised protein [Mycoplasmopsis fermentans]
MHRKNPKSSAIALIVLSLLSAVITGIAIFMFIDVAVKIFKSGEETNEYIKNNWKEIIIPTALILSILPISVASFVLHIVITIQASKLEDKKSMIILIIGFFVGILTFIGAFIYISDAQKENKNYFNYFKSDESIDSKAE